MRQNKWTWIAPGALAAAMALAGCGGGGGGGSSSPASPQLSAPHLRAISGNGTSITSGDSLSWTPSTGGAGVTYTVDRGTSANNMTSLATGLTTTSYADSSASANTLYYYQVVAQAPGLTSVSSNTDSATVGGPQPASLFGIGDPAGTTEPGAPFTGANFTLSTSAGTPANDTFTLSVTVDYVASVTDLKSVQYEGTVYTPANTPNFYKTSAPAAVTVTNNGNGTSTIVFNSANAGITPSSASPVYVPVIAGQEYTITANVAASSGSSIILPLEMTGQAGPQNNTTNQGGTTDNKYLFSITNNT